jgi:hypothetical protein
MNTRNGGKIEGIVVDEDSLSRNVKVYGRFISERVAARKILEFVFLV